MICVARDVAAGYNRAFVRSDHDRPSRAAVTMPACSGCPEVRAIDTNVSRYYLRFEGRSCQCFPLEYKGMNGLSSIHTMLHIVYTKSFIDCANRKT